MVDIPVEVCGGQIPENSLSFWNNGVRLLVADGQVTLMTTDDKIITGLKQVADKCPALTSGVALNLIYQAKPYEVLTFNKAYYQDPEGLEGVRVFDNIGNTILLSNSFGVTREITYDGFQKPIYQSINGTVMYYHYDASGKVIDISETAPKGIVPAVKKAE
ncbi:hypothetical protein [Shewanella algae]|uniref:hypothetical protein n=1 Tax=Shewanella algae TaxID=38313 RepID=UPI00300426F4